MSANLYDVQVEKLVYWAYPKEYGYVFFGSEKTKTEKKKLSDGKILNDRHRHFNTNNSKYYNMAIRNNINALRSMKSAVSFHLSSNERLQHGLCPAGINS
ncbi:hypothetical protein TNCV_2768691 [Trichonephila clavipes]|nr:hypothetical protein TNCV_2768691 [Trichonephila clavipes]